MRLPISSAISCSAAARPAAMETTFPVKDRGPGEADPADLAEAAVRVADSADQEVEAEAAVVRVVAALEVDADSMDVARGPAVLNSAIAAGPMAFTGWSRSR
jgi:hypothetical protein